MALSASANAAQPQDVTYLLRLQHTYGNENTCGLFRNDGQYHVERTSGEKTEISEGAMDAATFAKLKEILNSAEVSQLILDRVTLFDPNPDPMFTVVLLGMHRDRVGIDIWRGEDHQVLIFPNEGVRGPFKHWLEPLLHMVDSLRKETVHKLSEEGSRNNCLPPAPIELKTRERQANGEPRPVSAGTGPAPEQNTQKRPEPLQTASSEPGIVFRMSLRSMQELRAKKSCALVYSDGRYHVERFSQEYPWSPVNVDVFQGVLAAEELERVKSLVMAPVVQNLAAERVPEVFPYHLEESTVLSLPGSNGIRNFGFWKSRYYKPKGPKPTLAESNGGESLKPLREWVKNLAERQKGKSQRDVMPTDCIPDASASAPAI